MQNAKSCRAVNGDSAVILHFSLIIFHFAMAPFSPRSTQFEKQRERRGERGQDTSTAAQNHVEPYVPHFPVASHFISPPRTPSVSSGSSLCSAAATRRFNAGKQSFRRQTLGDTFGTVECLSRGRYDVMVP
jgi:hypothetical protein